MRRREIIGVLGSVAAWSIAARAQQRATPVIGLLSGASLQTMRQWVAAFHLGLADAGFTEDRNVMIEYRWAGGNNDRLPGLAMDLVRRSGHHRCDGQHTRSARCQGGHPSHS